MKNTRMIWLVAITGLVLAASCNSLLGIDDVGPLPPEPMCDIAPDLNLVVANSATSLLRQCSNGGGNCLSLFLNNDATPDTLSLQLYDGLGGHGAVNAPGMYALTTSDAKLETCGICGAVSANFDKTTSKFSQTYFASGQGILKLISIDSFGMNGRLTGLKFRHVNIANSVTSEVNDGCMSTIEDVEFTAEYSGTACTSACSSDNVCGFDDGKQVCCPNGFPFWCHGLNVCFSSLAERNAACGNAYYGDPGAGCKAGQSAVSIAGTTGSYCAPSCNGTGSSCPTSYNGKAGSCAVTSSGSSVPNRCILGCTHIGEQGGECLPSMTCRQASNGAGYCLY